MYTILGFGRQSRAILKYLLDNTNENIRTIDNVVEFQPTNPRHEHYCTKPDSRGISIAYAYEWDQHPKGGKNVVINCLPTSKSIETVEHCVLHDCDYLDLGGDDKVTEEIRKRSEMYEWDHISIVPDCGLAPGYASQVVGDLYRKGFRYIDIYCGGLPKLPKNLPLGYSLSFSPEGVIKEYTGESLHISNGRVESHVALSKTKPVHIPGFGVFEASNTSGGLSTTPYIYEGFVKHLNYMTLRYPGHWQYVKDRILDPTLYPVQTLRHQCPEINSDNPDIVIFMYEARKELGEVPAFYVEHWEFDHINNLSAMSLATGYNVSRVAKMLHEDKLEKGFVFQDDISID